MRLFVAVEIEPGEIPDDINIPERGINNDVRDKLVEIQNQLKTAEPSGVKWVEKENLHLTIKFIGETPESKLEQLKASINKAITGINKIDTSLSGIDVLPDKKSPRVIFARFSKNTEQIAELAEKIDQGLFSIGFEKEKRKFLAHLTIGRIKFPLKTKALVNKIEEMNKVNICETFIETVALFQSKLTPRGPIYTPIEKYILCN